MTPVLNSISAIAKILKKEKPSAVFLVTSERLLRKLAKSIKQIQRLSPGLTIITIPDGEAAKEWHQTELLLKALIQHGADRHALILALGGGSVGDLVGFVSSIYLRGISFVQIPTTLLAQVDSAHGGKTGINLSGIKNRVGSTYEPVAIVNDASFLASLSEAQVIDGLGEIIKAGLIKDVSILNLLKGETISSIRKSKNLPIIVRKSVAIKNFYTSKDYHDRGIRQMLNFGHTIGHGIEIKYKMSHGQAVIAGMIREIEIAETLAFTMKGVKERLMDLLKDLGIKPHLLHNPDWDSIRRDKKVRGENIMLPVLMREGQSHIVEVKLSEFKRALNATK